MISILLAATATEDNFDEGGYLAANPDVAAAVESGAFETGLLHFQQFGRDEGRRLSGSADVATLRRAKMEKLKPHLRTDMQHEWLGDKVSYLTEALREATRIVSTDAVSSNDYDGFGLSLINENSEGLILDCGAGSRGTYYANVVNYEIVNYESTDVLGVGEELPFADNTFDGVISVAVLEHVRDPFRCAAEISRVLKPGGRLYCSVPFLQPYHGYPHHYFNATAQGIRRLFEDELEVLDVDVIASTHPIFALQWILSSWSAGLTSETRENFEAMSVSDLLKSPLKAVREAFCQELPKEKQLELACATIMHARKPVKASLVTRR